MLLKITLLLVCFLITLAPAFLSDKLRVDDSIQPDCQADNVLFCAELHREIGEFDKCIELATPLAVCKEGGL